MRRSLARRPVVPEIKFFDYQLAPVNIPSQNTAQIIASTDVMSAGTSNGQRIGQEIMMRKLRMTYRLTAGHATGNTVFTTDAYVRLVFWTPRVSFVNAAAYMATLTMLQQVDYNVVTVHKDIREHLAPNTMNASVSVPGLNSQLPSGLFNEKLRTLNFKFPRRAKFPPPSSATPNALDNNKDIMYLTIFNDFQPAVSDLNFALVTRTTYVDS